MDLHGFDLDFGNFEASKGSLPPRRSEDEGGQKVEESEDVLGAHSLFDSLRGLLHRGCIAYSHRSCYHSPDHRIGRDNGAWRHYLLDEWS